MSINHEAAGKQQQRQSGAQASLQVRLQAGEQQVGARALMLEWHRLRATLASTHNPSEQLRIINRMRAIEHRYHQLL